MSKTKKASWQEAIEKLKREKRAEAKREFQEKKAAKQQQADYRARIAAVKIELTQFLEGEDGAYAKKLLAEKNVFLVLDIEGVEVGEEGGDHRGRIDWYVCGLDRDGLFERSCNRSTNQDGLANGEFVAWGDIDWSKRRDARVLDIVRTISSRIPPDQIVDYICGRIDDLAQRVLEK